MKKLITSMLVVGVIFMAFGCTPKPKSRIEIAFENYVERNFVEPNKYLGISSIAVVDSMDVIGIISDFEALMDSISVIHNDDIEYINKHLPKTSYSFKMNHAVEFSQILLSGLDHTLSTPNRKGSMKNNANSLLNLSDTTRRINRIYHANVKIKGNIEMTTYYIVDCALIDTILISPNPITTSDTPYPLCDVLTLIDSYKEETSKDLDILSGIHKIKESIFSELQKL